MNDIEELRKKIDVLKEQIEKHERRLLKENKNSTFPFPNEAARKIKEKIYALNYEIYIIEQTIEVNNNIPFLSGEVVDLYKNDENPRGNYIVCLHNSKTIIGEVGCNGPINNVHYVIYPKYRKKGYGFQALITMLNYLILNDFENIEILIQEENIPSLKLAEKLEVIFPIFNKEKKESRNYILYRFNLSKIIDEKHNISQK